MFEKDSLWHHVNNEKIKEKVHSNMPKLFQLLDELQGVLKRSLVVIFKDFRPQFPISPDAPDEIRRKVFAMCLLIKATNTLESMVVLTERGNLSDLKVLLRAIFETVIRLKAICQVEDYLEEYLGYDIHDRLKFLRAVYKNEEQFCQWHPPEKTGYKRDEVKREISSLEKEIKSKKLSENNTYNVAKMIGMETDYDFVYRFVCIDAHSSPKAVENSFMIEDDYIRDLNSRFGTTDNLEVTLSTGLVYFLKGLESCCELFGCEDIKLLKDYFDKVGEYYQKMNDRKERE